MTRARPPRLLVRTLTVTLVAVALLLSLIFVTVSLNVRQQVRQNVAVTLESTQRAFAELEALRQRELRAQAAVLAESPTLKAAIDTYAAESTLADDGAREQLLETVTRQLATVADHVQADAIVLVDHRQRTLAAIGPLASEWPVGARAPFTAHPASPGATDGVVRTEGRTYRAAWTDLTLDDTPIGTLYLATVLDNRYARALGRVSNAQIAIVDGGHLIASTLPNAVGRAFDAAIGGSAREDGTVDLADETFAFRRLVDMGDASFYALGSIDDLSRAPTASAMRTILYIALGAGALALAASVWLAQTITKPVGQLVQSLGAFASARDVKGRLVRSGSSRELDALTDTFNELMTSLAAAEAETEAAYTGAIRALAAALDARDPYTSGHSERVSVLSVAIGRTLSLSEDEVEVLRLGALLHDIGKIGVPDALLRKVGPLTEAEYEQVKQHPVLGARILRSVPFLAPHIPIVELHHERPDGGGYPYGLDAAATPLAARIVHVADAYDAMTSARAYRGARSAGMAIDELWRCAGTAFDATIVEALVMSLRGLPELMPVDARPVLSVVREA